MSANASKGPKLASLASRRVLRISAIFLIQVAVGLFTGYIGVDDTVSAIGFGNRLRGGLFLLGSIVILIGAIGVVVADRIDSLEWGGVALTGSVFSLVAMASMAILQWQGGDHHERLGIWLPMLILCIWCVYRLLKAGIVIEHPSRAAALLSVSTLLPIVSFLGPNVYQPASAPHYLQINAEFGKPVHMQGKTMVAVPFTVKMKNPANTRLYVIGSSYSVAGRKTKPATNAAVGMLMQNAVLEGRPITRNIGSITYELLQADGIVGPETFLEPGEEYVSTEILHVPIRNDYDILRLEASALVVRGDRLIPTLKDYVTSWDSHGRHVEDAPEWVAPKGTPFLHSVFELDETSTVRKFTREPQRLNVWWVLTNANPGSSRIPYLSSIIAQAGEEADQPGPDVEQRLLRRYGLELTSPIVIELSTWSLQGALSKTS